LLLLLQSVRHAPKRASDMPEKAIRPLIVHTVIPTGRKAGDTLGATDETKCHPYV
jgi:hypothetical protein